MRLIYILSAISLLALTSCSAMSEEGKEELAKPVSCTTAEKDMQVLKEEHASVGKRIAAGVGDIFPVGAVVNIIGGTWTDNAKVASGDYNDQIEAKIKEIESSCGVSSADV